jgi:hypothetical protein
LNVAIGDKRNWWRISAGCQETDRALLGLRSEALRLQQQAAENIF